jgi:hypothetical protein
MTSGYARLVGIEVRAMPSETVLRLDVQQREPVPKHGGVLRATQQPFETPVGEAVGRIAFDDTASFDRRTPQGVRDFEVVRDESGHERCLSSARAGSERIGIVGCQGARDRHAGGRRTPTSV